MSTFLDQPTMLDQCTTGTKRTSNHALGYPGRLTSQQAFCRGSSAKKASPFFAVASGSTATTSAKRWQPSSTYGTRWALDRRLRPVRIPTTSDVLRIRIRPRNTTDLPQLVQQRWTRT